MSENSQSIHSNGRMDNGRYANTSRPHKGGGKLAKRQTNLNRRRLAREDTVRSVKGNKNPQGAYRVPGSMNQHK